VPKNHLYLLTSLLLYYHSTDLTTITPDVDAGSFFSRQFNYCTLCTISIIIIMCGLPFTVTCPSADVTVRCCTARLHPLSARNLETNVTDSVAYHSLFRFYVVHVNAFLLLFFCVPSAPSCSSSRLTVYRQTGQSVPSVRHRRDRQIGHFHCPVMF